MKTKENYSFLQIVLTVVFVGALMISNVLANKSIAFASQCAAIVVFPITYILSDVFSEVYGYKWSRITCYLAFGLNILMVLMFKLSMILPADATWFNTEEAWANTLSVSYITFASLIAFVVGDFVNDRVFRALKKKHPGKGEFRGFGFRAILSSLAGELMDSCVFIPFAFLILPRVFNEPWMILPVDVAIKRIIFGALLKVAYEVVILPVTELVVRKVNKYEEAQAAIPVAENN